MADSRRQIAGSGDRKNSLAPSAICCLSPDILQPMTPRITQADYLPRAYRARSRPASAASGRVSSCATAIWSPTARPASIPLAIASRRPGRLPAVAAQHHGIPRVTRSLRRAARRSGSRGVDIAVPPDVQLDVIRAGVSRRRGQDSRHPGAKAAGDELRAGQGDRATCARAAGITLAVNQNMRYDQSVRACKDAARPRVLGEPVLATIDMRAIPHWMPWQQRQGWVTLRIMSIHHLDTFRYWFGDPSAFLPRQRARPRLPAARRALRRDRARHRPATMEPGRNPRRDLDVIERELASYGGLEDRPRLVALNKIDVPDGRDMADIVSEDVEARGLRRSSRSARPATRACASCRSRWPRSCAARARRGAGRGRAERIVLRPAVAPTAATEFTVRETGDPRQARTRAGGCAAPSPSAGCGRPTSATTRPSASSPTGSTGSASRPGCSQLGAVEGDTCSSATPTTPWSSTSSPASTPAPRCSAAAARTSGSTRRVRPPAAAATIDEAMPDRGEGETRADVARRLDSPTADDEPDRLRRRPRPTLAADDPGATQRRMTGRGPARAGRRGAARVVVKVGSSSLTTAAGGIDPERVRRAGRRARRRPRRAAPRSCWSPPARSPPGSPRSALRAPPARPGHPAGRRVGRPGAAGAPLHRGVRPARHRRRPGAAHRRRRDPAQPLPQRLPAPSPSCSSSACCRSSTRTTRSPPPRSGSATTTGSPPWSPTWCTPTCWCCSPTSTACTTGHPARGRQHAWSPTCARRPTWTASRVGRAGAAGVGTGGMQTKVEAARIATGAGIPVVLTSADHAADALAGEPVGTLSTPTGRRRPTRLLWLAHATEPQGRAPPRRRAPSARVTERRASLLPAGITGVTGHVRRRRPGRPASAPTGRRSPAGWSTTTPTSCPRCSAGPPATSPASSARRTSARSCTATTWSLPRPLNAEQYISAISADSLAHRARVCRRLVVSPRRSRGRRLCTKRGAA